MKGFHIARITIHAIMVDYASNCSRLAKLYMRVYPPFEYLHVFSVQDDHGLDSFTDHAASKISQTALCSWNVYNVKLGSLAFSIHPTGPS